jgi:hypothetical protein
MASLPAHPLALHIPLALPLSLPLFLPFSLLLSLPSYPPPPARPPSLPPSLPPPEICRTAEAALGSDVEYMRMRKATMDSADFKTRPNAVQVLMRTRIHTFPTPRTCMHARTHSFIHVCIQAPCGKTRRKVIRTKETRTHFVDPSTAAAQLTHGCGRSRWHHRWSRQLSTLTPTSSCACRTRVLRPALSVRFSFFLFTPRPPLYVLLGFSWCGILHYIWQNTHVLAGRQRSTSRTCPPSASRPRIRPPAR